MIKRLLICCAIVWMSFPLLAQQHSPWCGTVSTEDGPMRERLRENLATIRNNPPVRFRETIWIPLKIHLIARNNGTGRIRESNVLGQLCTLNEDFASQDIQFYIYEGFSYIDNSAMYDDPSSTADGIMGFLREQDAIDIWVSGNIPNSQIENGQTLGYYSPNFDWLVVKRSEFNSFSSTLTHEMGHFFSLDHPFHGWDYDPYDPDVHGTPAPATSPRGVPTELADGSNCATAGDMICDTPADYNFFSEISSCNYQGGALDPTGAPVDPDERLFMGYFNGCDRDEYYFSEEQGQVMQADYLSNRRNYLRGNYTPNTNEITAIPTAISPDGTQPIDGYNAVTFEWSAVEHADAYLLEIDALPSLSSNNVQSFIVYGTSKVITTLEANKRYYWRVRAFNETQMCEMPTSSTQFRTPLQTAVRHLEAVDAFTLIPNPVPSQQQVTLELKINKGFEGQLDIFDISGKLVQTTSPQWFESGKNLLTVPTTNFVPGIYFLRLSSEGKVSTQRLVITQ